MSTTIVTYAQPQPRNWYRGFIQGKTRILAAWAFAILLGLTARDYPQWPGILLCLAGAALRYWASGYLRKDARPAAGGPYAFVRNPLYLGTYLMALGTTWAIQSYTILAALTVLYAALYHFIILDEEVKLRAIFGQPYERYTQLVPRFFPRPWPAKRESLLEVNPEQAHHHFSKELASRNKAYEAFASFAGLIGYVALAAYLWKTLG
jgi:hypothetical protein